MKHWKVLAFLFALQVLIHLPFINLPPCGSHVWRQCNTLALSRNFAEENMNILEPRIDRRNETDGITGSNFPLYEWGLACIYKVTGEHYWVSRLYSALLFSFGLFVFYLLLLEMNIDKRSALAGSLILLSVPQLFYDGINAMPDIAGFTAGLSSAYCFAIFIKSRRYKWLISAFLFGSLAGMIKVQFLIMPFAFTLFAPIGGSAFYKVSVANLLSLIPVYIWYKHALALTERNNLREFGLWIKPITLKEKAATIAQNLFSDIPELILGWPLLIALLFLLFRYWKTLDLKPYRAIFLIWALGFAVFYVIGIERMARHPYYMISLIPLMVLILVTGFHSVGIKSKILFGIFFLNLVWALLRIVPSRWQHDHYQIPKTFVDQAALKALRQAIPHSEKYIIGPDISGCIYFYFTRTKGYSFSNTDELMEDKGGKPAIDRMYEHGAKVLICGDNKEVRQALKEHGYWQLQKDLGEFSIWSHR